MSMSSTSVTCLCALPARPMWRSALLGRQFYRSTSIHPTRALHFQRRCPVSSRNVASHSSGEYGPLPPEEDLIDALEGGTWRLQARMSQAFWGFCVGLERVLFEFIGDMDIADFDDKYHLWDSMDPKGEELLSWMTITDPKKEEEGFPRMLVENRIYTSSKFRKMHLELAWKQDGLQVLHIVLFPNDNLDIPIFGVDMVAFGDNVSLAIVDLHPASMSGQLPPIYTQGFEMVMEKYGMRSRVSRQLPDWQQEISSDYVVAMRPETEADLTNFMEYAAALLLMHVKIAENVSPLTSPPRLQDIRQAHTRFCRNMLGNKKTLGQLASRFGEEDARTYMREIMFDCPLD